MKVRFIWIGKTKEKSFRLLIDEYCQRLKHYVKFELLELKELKKKSSSIDEQKKEEGELFISHIDKLDYVILMDETGESLSSRELAGFIQKHANHTSQNICLIIGGAYGFDENIRRVAQKSISLSKMTFTHDMARLILLEQIYRAFTILKGEKYHND